VHANTTQNDLDLKHSFRLCFKSWVQISEFLVAPELKTGSNKYQATIKWVSVVSFFGWEARFFLLN
jgi:hypothetical protein